MLLRLPQLIRRDLGDEPQHPRVLRQTQQILHVVQQPIPLLRLLCLGDHIPQEPTDLLLAKFLQLHQPVPRHLLRPLRQRPPDLTIRQEVLRPARHHHLGVALRRGHHRLEVLQRPVVGQPQRQLVEAVEQQRDPPLGEQVLERIEIDPAHVGIGKVLRQEPLERGLLVQLAHLHQHRHERVLIPRHPPRQLVEQERFPRAEVPQHQRKARVGRLQQLPQRLQRALCRLLLAPPRQAPSRRLFDIEPGWIHRVHLEPARLLLQVRPEVEEPLVLPEALEHHAPPRRGPSQLGRSRRAPVDEHGAEQRILLPERLLDLRLIPREQLHGDGLLDGGDDPQIHEAAVLHRDLQHPRKRGRRLVPRHAGAGIPQHRHPLHPRQKAIPPILEEPLPGLHAALARGRLAPMRRRTARPLLRLQVLLQERQQHRRRRVAGKAPEAVVLVGVGVITHRLHQDRPLLEAGREIPDGGALHLHPQGPAHEVAQAAPDRGVLLHHLHRRDGADVDAERPIRGRPVRVEEPIVEHRLPSSIGERHATGRGDDQALAESSLDLRRPVRAGAGAVGMPDRRRPALHLVHVQRVQHPPPLHLLRRRARAGERRQIELARQVGGVHLPGGLDVEGAQIVEELVVLAVLALLAGGGDALPLAVAVEPVGHDHVPERHLVAEPRADAAHRQAGRIELAEELLPPDGGGALAHLADPRRRDRQRTPAGAGEGATEVTEAAEIPHLAPARAAALAERQHRLQLVLKGRDDEHVHRPVGDGGARAGERFLVVERHATDDTPPPDVFPSRAPLLVGTASLLVGTASLLAGTPSLLAGTASLLVGTASLLVGAPSLLVCAPSLLARPTSLLVGTASLLAHPASLLPHPASLLIGAASLLVGTASLLFRAASLLAHPASLLARPTSLLVGAASLLPHPASLLPHPASLLVGTTSLLVGGYPSLVGTPSLLVGTASLLVGALRAPSRRVASQKIIVPALEKPSRLSTR